jgi:hypothetical protein
VREPAAAIRSLRSRPSRSVRLGVGGHAEFAAEPQMAVDADPVTIGDQNQQQIRAQLAAGERAEEAVDVAKPLRNDGIALC